MKKSSLFCLSILTSSLFPGACFLFGMVIIGCKLGCFRSTICTMMIPLSTFLLIPLSLAPLLGLLSSSLPW
jgi:hypothetical protein